MTSSCHHHRNCHICSTIGLIQLTLIVAIIKNTYENFFTQRDFIGHYVNGNLIAIMHLDRIASLFASMLLLKSISFHHRLYYANPAITILNNVLFNNNQKYFHPPYRYRLKMASIVVRNMTKKVINSFVSFIIMLSKYNY